MSWIDPVLDESLQSYAHRMMKHHGVDQVESPILLGLSFGGMLVTEIAKLIPGSKAILVSTSETRDELPLSIKAGARIKVNKYIPDMFLHPPIELASKFFGTEKKELLQAILNDSDTSFTKWALGAIGNWDNEKRLTDRLKIHGTSDLVIPFSDESAIAIKGGTHFMIIDRADEVSSVINSYLKKLEPPPPKTPAS